MKNWLWLCIVVIVFVGCTTMPIPQLTREEWLSMTQHTFKDTTVDKVLEASEKVLRLSDPKDVTTQHSPNKMRGKRKLYTVIKAPRGWFNFDLDAVQQDSDVKTTLNISLAWQYSPELTIWPYKNDYALYFLRMESLLYGKPWMTCEQAKAFYKEEDEERHVGALCYDADDIDPNALPSR